MAQGPSRVVVAFVVDVNYAVVHIVSAATPCLVVCKKWRKRVVLSSLARDATS